MRPLCLQYQQCVFVMATATCLPPIHPTELTKSAKTAAGNHGGHPHTPRAARASCDGHERRSNGWAQQQTQHRQKTRTQDQSSNSPAPPRTGKRRQYHERQPGSRGAADTGKEQPSPHNRTRYIVRMLIVYFHYYFAVAGGPTTVVIAEEVAQTTGKHISCKIREQLG